MNKQDLLNQFAAFLDVCENQNMVPGALIMVSTEQDPDKGATAIFQNVINGERMELTCTGLQSICLKFALSKPDEQMRVTPNKEGFFNSKN